MGHFKGAGGKEIFARLDGGQDDTFQDGDFVAEQEVVGGFGGQAGLVDAKVINADENDIFINTETGAAVVEIDEIL